MSCFSKRGIFAGTLNFRMKKDKSYKEALRGWDLAVSMVVIQKQIKERIAQVDRSGTLGNVQDTIVVDEGITEAGRWTALIQWNTRANGRAVKANVIRDDLNLGAHQENLLLYQFIHSLTYAYGFGSPFRVCVM